jgi:hypothetical protein
VSERRRRQARRDENVEGAKRADEVDQGGVDPRTVGDAPVRPPSAPAVAMGRAMMGLGEIIEGKPPRDEAEQILVVADSGEPEPEHPSDLIIEINPN